MLLRELFIEQASPSVGGLPNPYGTEPVNPGYVRLYHQTDRENIEDIKKYGIQLTKARGIEGPKGIWAGEKPFYGSPEDIPTIEFQIPKENWYAPWVIQDEVKPEEFIAVHEPWHKHARYILDKEDNPGLLDRVLDGEFDDAPEADPDYGPAIAYVKSLYKNKKVKESRLTELADNPAKVEVKKEHPNWWIIDCPEFDLKIKFIRYAQRPTNIEGKSYFPSIEIDFDVEGQFHITGKGQGKKFRILSTVYHAIKDNLNLFIKPEDQAVYFISDIDEPSRMSLYSTAGPKYIGQILGSNWSHFTSRHGTDFRYVWVRKNLRFGR